MGTWKGRDRLAPAKTPPCGLGVSEVPQFVTLGFDDNGDAEGMTWALDMLAARSSKASFYMTSDYGQDAQVFTTWRRARDEGHELGNHTIDHADGASFSLEDWQREIDGCNDFLTAGDDPLVRPSDLVGFRTPYLSYNDAMLSAVQGAGLTYDCSIEEGYEDGQDGKNFFWPYTLDDLSPGHSAQVAWGDGKQELSLHAGLWELPVYVVFVPPDEACEAYGVPSGFRAKMKSVQDWFDADSGAITGFDYNLWAAKADGGFEMTPAEFVATLKYTFDQRLAGNKAPFLLGVHSAYYGSEWDGNSPGAQTAKERQEAVEAFLDYVLQHGAEVVSARQVLQWMRDPVARVGN
ncbi:MAG: polysaccharide deacetylase family protein [Polyangiaceae bacterium]